MDRAFPDIRTDDSTCMSPPSPAFSLDSSSPFENGLHFDSILFEEEDEEEGERTDTRFSLERRSCSPKTAKKSSTNPKLGFKIENGLHKNGKACKSVKKIENVQEQQGGQCNAASLKCVRKVTPGNSRCFIMLWDKKVINDCFCILSQTASRCLLANVSKHGCILLPYQHYIYCSFLPMARKLYRIRSFVHMATFVKRNSCLKAIKAIHPMQYTQCCHSVLEG